MVRSIGAILCCCLLGGGGAAADDAAALWAALRAGGRIALIRHTEAPGGAGDPTGFRLDDCTTQRNLSDKGRADARRLGERFRDNRIAVGTVLSSRWCRCRETAALMAVGAVEDAATFDNSFVLRERRDELAAGGRAAIAAWRGPGVLVVVTHGDNIFGLVGMRPGEGDIVVVETEAAASGNVRVLGRIAFGERPP